ncbi:MAG: RNA 2',3'-cyclic phosphodiesterase [Candidatus Moranbacteria bacterium CG23_combo_of_CG06-09_8_20_14_all_35_22]|nr:MAG: RNA 2',3'-cyclic phosphodiesterase [Candidatus Moranbacteria bacterium CG23_combo_of_CG06-09_8_20_14_all_35_22]
MKSRIFISFNIPEKAKKGLLLVTEKWRDLPVKWIRENNLHITLVFLGLVSEEAILEICEKTRAICEKENIFDIEFDQIELFPLKEEPKIIALTGKPSEELKNLVNNIEKGLGISNTPKKSFRAHITLGRIRKYKWEALESKPEILEKFPLNLSIESVEIISSELNENGSNYLTLESCPLK